MADTATPTEEAPPDTSARDKVLADLAELAPRITELERQLHAAYDERLALYLAGRAAEPPATQHQLAGAAGVTGVAVSKALTKARARSDV